MAKFQIHVEVKIRDIKTGKLIKRARKKLCNSYVLSMIDLIRSQWAVSTDSLIDTINQSRVMSSYGSGLMSSCWVNAGVNDDSFGIQIGSTAGATTIAMYKLVAQILNATVAHGSVSVGSPITLGSTRQFVVARTFTNTSGNNVTVQEVALVTAIKIGGTTVRNFMMERSLLNFVIVNGTSGTVTYTISVTA